MFRPNRAAKAQLQRDPRLRLLKREKAAEIVRNAGLVAPDRTGYYKRSLRVTEDEGTVAASSFDPFAHLVEFGSINNPAYAPLRRGARASGLDIRDD